MFSKSVKRRCQIAKEKQNYTIDHYFSHKVIEFYSIIFKCIMADLFMISQHGLDALNVSKAWNVSQLEQIWKYKIK